MCCFVLASVDVWMYAQSWREWNGSSILIVQINMQQHSNESKEKSQNNNKSDRKKEHYAYTCTNIKTIWCTQTKTRPANTITFWKVLHIFSAFFSCCCCCLSFQHEFQQMFLFHSIFAMRSSSFSCITSIYIVSTHTLDIFMYKYLCTTHMRRMKYRFFSFFLYHLKAKL